MGRAWCEAVFSRACSGAVVCDKADDMGLWLLGQLHCCLHMLVGGNNEIVAVAEDEAPGGVCLGWLGFAGVGEAVWLKGEERRLEC